jgi:predicted RND superfamily exporter protein
MIAHHAPLSLARLRSNGDPEQIAKAEYVSFVMLLVKQLRAVADHIESDPNYPLSDEKWRGRTAKIRRFRRMVTRLYQMGGKYASNRKQILQGGLMSPR